MEHACSYLKNNELPVTGDVLVLAGDIFYLKDKTAVAELFRTIAPKIADRPGGYLRILHVGFRQGDGSEMALIEFVDFNEAALAAPKETKKATRRSRAKKAEAAPAAEAEAPKAE